MKAIEGRRLVGGPFDLEGSGDGVRSGRRRLSLGDPQTAGVEAERVPLQADAGREDQDRDGAGRDGEPVPNGQDPPAHGKAFRSSSK